MGLSIKNYVHHPRKRPTFGVGERADGERGMGKRLQLEVVIPCRSADVVAALHERTSFVHDGVFAETLGVSYHGYRVVVGYRYLDVGHDRFLLIV